MQISTFFSIFLPAFFVYTRLHLPFCATANPFWKCPEYIFRCLSVTRSKTPGNSLPGLAVFWRPNICIPHPSLRVLSPLLQPVPKLRQNNTNQKWKFTLSDNIISYRRAARLTISVSDYPSFFSKFSEFCPALTSFLPYRTCRAHVRTAAPIFLAFLFFWPKYRTAIFFAVTHTSGFLPVVPLSTFLLRLLFPPALQPSTQHEAFLLLSQKVDVMFLEGQPLKYSFRPAERTYTTAAYTPAAKIPDARSNNASEYAGLCDVWVEIPLSSTLTGSHLSSDLFRECLGYRALHPRRILRPNTAGKM